MAFWTPERKVGITLSAMAALFVIVTFSIKGYKPFGEKYPVVGQFDSVGLLTPGAAVRLRGVQIGQVEGVDLQERGAGVLVNMSIDTDQPLLEGTRASILTSGLMGEQYIELEPPVGVSDRDRDYIKPGGLIYGEQMFGVEEAKRQLGDVLEDVSAILTEAKGMISDATMKVAFQNTVINLEQLTDSLNTVMGRPEQGQQIVANLVDAVSKANKSMDRVLDLQDQLSGVVSENRADIRETIIAAKDAMEGIRDQMGNLADSLGSLSQKVDGVLARNEGSVDATLDNVRKASESAARTAERLDRIVQNIEAGQGALGALIADPEVERSVRQSLRSAEELVGEASGMMDQAHSVMSKADNTLDTVEAIRGGFGVEYDLSFFGEDKRYGDDGNHLRNDLGVTWENDVHRVKLGANRIGEDTGVELSYGYRWRDLRFLGGVYESDAMLGLEWLPHEKFLFGVRGVDLTDEGHERADFYGLLRVHDHVGLRAGVEDAFDENYWFGGIGLSF